MWSAGVMLYWLFTQQLPFFNSGEVASRGKLRIEDIAAAVTGAPITWVGTLSLGGWDISLPPSHGSRDLARVMGLQVLLAIAHQSEMA